MVKAVSESSLPPEQWRPLFDKAGIEFGYRPLAARAGLTHTRVHRLVRGGGTTDDAIQAVADALGVKASKVRELRNEPAVDIEPFTLPDDAGRLTNGERDVIRAMVRALLNARELHHADQPETDTDSSAPTGASDETSKDEEDRSPDEPESAVAGLDRAEADLREHVKRNKNRSDKRA